MLDAITAPHEPTEPTVRSLVERDEFGPLTGRPGGLSTAPIVPLALARDELGRRIAAWVPDGQPL